jgi:hypothetical protein
MTPGRPPKLGVGGPAALAVGVVAGLWVFFRVQRAERRGRAAGTFRAELADGDDGVLLNVPFESLRADVRN